MALSDQTRYRYSSRWLHSKAKNMMLEVMAMADEAKIPTLDFDTRSFVRGWVDRHPDKVVEILDWLALWASLYPAHGGDHGQSTDQDA